ncbi:1924_t:CDS:1 [Ambispora gerdemannii]|uniref:1924_t:CDS:1 n=1 Tax=Ambispora gerdemannii TaxID=144530 RepID=A0A9N9FXT0_9GLOM|nr:1924_t:CDS:1 [Ambispora gerdemannii]
MTRIISSNPLLGLSSKQKVASFSWLNLRNLLGKNNANKAEIKSISNTATNRTATSIIDDKKETSPVKFAENDKETSVEFAEPSHENEKEIKDQKAKKRTFHKWTTRDQEKLEQAMKIYGKDWEKISKHYFDSKRSPPSIYEKYCKNLKESKAVNSKYMKWTSEEDRTLEKAVATLGEGNWQEIAKEFLPSKSGPQILNRWKIISSKKRGNWTPEEDKALREFVKTHGFKWSLASEVFKRPHVRIFERWDRYVAPGLKSGPWSKEELEILKDAVEKFGTDWDQIKKALPHRSLYFIKQKYRNSPSVRTEFNKGPWSLNEELTLVEAVNKYGRRWNDVSNMIGTRSPDQCCCYYSKTKL